MNGSLSLQRLKIPFYLLKSRWVESVTFSPFVVTGLWATSMTASISLFEGISAIPIWILLTASIYILNDLSDIKIDRENELEKPLVDGNVSKNGAWLTCIGLATFSLISTAMLSKAFLLIALIYLALGVAYSSPPIRLKKRIWGKAFTVGSAAILSFSAGGSVVSSFPPSLLYIMLFFSPFAYLSPPINDLRDIKGDRKAGCKTVPLVLGTKKTINLGILGALGTAALTIPGYVFLSFNIIFVIGGLLVIGFILKRYVTLRNASNQTEFKKLRKVAIMASPLLHLSIIAGLL